MKKDYLLTNAAAKKLYRIACELPIYDYHCHLSAEEIFHDRVFESPGEMMLKCDHYKWRLMRAAGISEQYITGKAPWLDKFRAYAKALETSPGNPLYHWTAMELSRYFGIDEELTAENAASLYARAQKTMAERRMSPRSLILSSGVRYIATTDDPVCSLVYHEKLKADSRFPVTVVPSFRTDRLVTVNAPGYGDYLRTLGELTGVEIDSLDAFKKAIFIRLDAFCAAGCKFTDVGIEQFPRAYATEEEAVELFDKILTEDDIGETEASLFAGYLFVFLGREYRKRNLVMQWHLAVKRNANRDLFRSLGADCGGDCIGNEISNDAVITLLNAIGAQDELPQTIIYTLNPAMAPRLASLCGSFPHVRMGAAWWFCDHLRGIREQLCILAEQGCLGTFPGMLTDSRSFLSYARHDYYRRILCSLLGEWVEKGECGMEAAQRLIEPLCGGNTKKLAGI